MTEHQLAMQQVAEHRFVGALPARAEPQANLFAGEVAQLCELEPALSALDGERLAPLSECGERERIAQPLAMQQRLMRAAGPALQHGRVRATATPTQRMTRAIAEF